MCRPPSAAQQLRSVPVSVRNRIVIIRVAIDRLLADNLAQLPKR